ncbi:MAG: HNH endonuclease signature motif containing protein [Bacilli bacterium]|nr:HNH endonuclease signature motif containing protein [Bacilli bacterium]
MKTKRMDLNRETAMRLWNKSFGKETKVIDFAGRTIVKGAYNDRGSDFGWNVDHILPQSKGGKTADHNLVCCHILTNDEKADKFPAFKANGITFEIIKVENHYELKRVDNKAPKKKVVNDDSVNFMDSASGIRFFKKLKGIQNKSRFVGSVLIRLENVTNTSVIDFIEKYLNEENISYSMKNNYWNAETRIVAKNYNMPLKEDNAKLLDKCIVLNTYIKEYFIPMGYVKNYDICYQVNCFEDKQDMYLEAQKINFDNMNGNLDNALFINELVYINTEAKDREPNLDFSYYNYQKYDYTFTKLSKNLEKEVSGK